MKCVQSFYNRIPFPDFDFRRYRDREDLKLCAYPFARVLDRSIPASASVIDVCTGTGQLPAFLSLRRKHVWGVDFSDTSLEKARWLKDKLDLNSLYLKNVNVTDINQVMGVGRKFDYVLCFGALHHIKDSYRAFQNIVWLLKPKGHIAVGLYNSFGRLPLKARRLLARTVFRNNEKVKEWFIKMQIGSVEDRERANAWWNDQYMHPYESTHTLGEVLKWFKKNGIRYYQTLPSCKPFDQSVLDVAGVWNDCDEPYPNLLVRLYKQLCWIWRTHREGGYWITFGKKEW
jgi:SAM-dependent methyltransferase